MREVTIYKTYDNKSFNTQSAAVDHCMEKVRVRLTRLFESEINSGDAVKLANKLLLKPDLHAELDNILMWLNETEIDEDD